MQSRTPEVTESKQLVKTKRDKTCQRPVSAKHQFVATSDTQAGYKTSTSPRPCSPTLQAGQLGGTAENISSFLIRNRPMSPSSSRSRPTTPTTAAIKQQQQVHTVDDALQLFAQHGLNAAPKLFHAIPAAPAAQEAEEAASYSRTASSKRRTEACPYDLQVVPRCQLPACYCTVTATGVVQVPGNGEPCVHIPIGMWVRGGSMFRVFRGLRAFKHIWQGHTMRRWHANVRRLVFQCNRQHLTQQLLVLKLPYLKLLMDSRSKMGAILSAGALQPMPPGLYKLEMLVEQQQEYHLSKLAPLIARTITAIIADVEQTASRLQSSEQLLRRELQSYSKDPSAGAAQGLNSVKIRAERDAIAGKHASALYDLQRLPAFLRLLGLHVLQSYLDLLVGAVSGLKAHLEGPGNSLVVNLVLEKGGVALSPTMEELLKGLSKGIIEHLVGVLKAAPRPLKHASLAALLEDPVKSSSIVNSCIAARNAMSSTGGAAGPAPACRVSDWGSGLGIAAGIAGVASPGAQAARRSSTTAAANDATRRLGSGVAPATGAASPATAGWSVKANGAVLLPVAVPLPSWLANREDDEPGADGGQLLMMMVGDQNLATLRRAMDQQVMRSYREASQVTDALAELSVLLRFVHLWDAAAYKAMQRTTAQLRKDTLLLREWQAQLQVVCDSQSVGLLQLQTSFLKTTYMTKLSSAQATIAMMLVSAARKECQAAIAELHSLVRDLAPQPSKLAEFIAFKLRVKEVWHTRDWVAGVRPSQVADMYTTATAWGSRLPHTDQVLLDDLQEAVRGFTRSLTAAVAFVDSRHAGMLALLDRQAKEVLKKVQELLKMLEAASMAQRLHIPAAAGLTVTADKLTAWQQQLQGLSDASAAINKQESQLGVKLTYYADLDEAGRVLKETQEAFSGSSRSAEQQQ